jgi:glutaredoxin
MIKIYSDENCPHCKRLKDKLDVLDIKYVDIDVDNEDNAEDVNTIFGIAEEHVIPIIIIQQNILIPRKSFNTIDEAVKLIQSLIEK